MISWLRKKLRPKREIVLDILESYGPLGAADIANRSMGRLRPSGIYPLLMNLEKDGFIIRHERDCRAVFLISREGRLVLAQIRTS